jgi:ectoine hydroxylase-related dioxygenase (phytanoyl-CoA dioxygenase family)
MTAPVRVMQADVDSFREDGFTVLRGVLDTDDVVRLAQAINEHRQAEADGTSPDDDGGYGSYNSDTSRDFFLRVPAVARWHAETETATAAAALLETASARPVRDRLFVKSAGDGAGTMWHQDHPLTKEASGELVVMWIPLAIDGEAGAPLRVARASQHGPKMIESGIATWRHVEGTDAEVVEADVIENQFEVVTAAASVGDIVALHGFVLHASLPNRSASERVALSTRFIPV